ncbi:MAG: ATP-grasp domain-containing protein [Muribaculaceae bacterium]|nr:ATP-grasp domain-containing protein [Muribaculaceae bacterium]
MGNKKKLAVIGASSGQLSIVRKAREMGIHTVCFAWDKGAVCKKECDEFYPISIFDIDDITAECKRLGVDGVVSTASEETAAVVAEVASRLGLNGTPPEVLRRIQHKDEVRRLTQHLECLVSPRVWTPEQRGEIVFPCIVKPVKGSAKRGVSYCETGADLDDALRYAAASGQDVMIEEFIPGPELAIENLSYHGRHKVIQITRKVNSGIPHFVEMELHQSPEIWAANHTVAQKAVSAILDAVGFTDGASHIEMKIRGDKACLIEINPRGAGDRTDTLISLSTDFNYIEGMIDIALDKYKETPVVHNGYSGILFLTAQTSRLMKYFDDKEYDWLVERRRLTSGPELTESTGNYERDGYIIYQSTKTLDL